MYSFIHTVSTVSVCVCVYVKIWENLQWLPVVVVNERAKGSEVIMDLFGVNGTEHEIVDLLSMSMLNTDEKAAAEGTKSAPPSSAKRSSPTLAFDSSTVSELLFGGHDRNVEEIHTQILQFSAVLKNKIKQIVDTRNLFQTMASGLENIWKQKV